MPLTRRRFLKTSLVSLAGTALAGLGSYAYARDIEPSWVEVVPVTLRLPRLSSAFDGYRVVHISDIHLGTGVMTAERLAFIVDMVNAQQPDLVAITGDFVTHPPIDPLIPGLVVTLMQLTPRDAAAAVLGNHDHWTAPDEIRQMLRDTGVVDLSNSVHTIRRGAAALHIAGVDDWWERQDRLDLVLAQLPEDGAAVLLAHEPDYADISAASGRFDLQLSGHSHGGQVIVPFVGPIVLPRYGRKYPLGLYSVGSMWQYTNRGIGTVKPSVRFNCRPEITVFTLTSTL